MAKHSLLGNVVKIAAAAAAVSGICYLFKDEIKGSKAYQQLDVEEKISKAKTAIKDTKNQIKEKAPWANTEQDIIEDDEIILDSNAPKERDYVSLDGEETKTEEVAADEELIPEEEVKEAVNEAVEEVTEKVTDAVEEAAATVNEAETIEI